jgi:hypothetical protein
VGFFLGKPLNLGKTIAIFPPNLRKNLKAPDRGGAVKGGFSNSDGTEGVCVVAHEISLLILVS